MRSSVKIGLTLGNAVNQFQLAKMSTGRNLNLRVMRLVTSTNKTNRENSLKVMACKERRVLLNPRDSILEQSPFNLPYSFPLCVDSNINHRHLCST